MNTILSRLFPDRPYFEGGTAGRQSVIARHAEFASFVSMLDVPRVSILEIGSWTGHSALTWSEAIAAFCPGKGTLVCVDPWRPYFESGDVGGSGPYVQMESLAHGGLAYDLFLHNTRFCALGVEIRHLRGGLADFAEFLRDESFDIVYVDGSHYHADVLSDLRIGHRLLRTGGILCGDDLELQEDDCDAEFARRHPRTDFVADPRTGRMFHPGVATAVREFFGTRIWEENGTWAMHKVNADAYSSPPVQRRRFIVPSHFAPGDREMIRQSIPEAARA